MVFSNEPGILPPGVDGYRIDSMVVTATGAERLSRYLAEHGPDDRVIPIRIDRGLARLADSARINKYPCPSAPIALSRSLLRFS